MSRLTNLFDKLKAHLQQTSTVVIGPYKFFRPVAAVLSSGLGLLLGTPWFLAMASKEIALSFTAEGDVTLKDKMAREENFDCILTEKENKIFQTYISMPTSVFGTVMDKVIGYPYDLVQKGVSKIEDWLRGTEEPTLTTAPFPPMDETSESKDSGYVKGSTSKIFNDIDLNDESQLDVVSTHEHKAGESDTIAQEKSAVVQDHSFANQYRPR